MSKPATISLLALGLVPSLAAVEPVRAQISELTDPLASQHYLMGTALFDVLRMDNNPFVNGDDTEEYGRIRAEYGAKVQLQDKVELNLSVVADFEAGHNSWNESTEAEVAFNTAYASFKRFLHPSFDWEIGRMPAAWNLREGEGAFVVDSRANDPLVTSWDGFRAILDLEQWRIQPFLYVLDEPTDLNDGDPSNEIYGIVVDWQPESEIGSEIFLTASYTIENSPLYGPATNLQRGKELQTWYIGLDWELANGWDFYGEYAGQSGDVNDTDSFGGSAFSVGVDWHLPIGGSYERSALSLQYDNISGDEGGGDNDAFINHHEGVSDFYLVEHERYGELSELLDGNLEAYKLRWEWIFLPENNFGTQVGYAWYQIPETAPGQDDQFGQEINVSLHWDYNFYTTFTIFGAYFNPGDGYEDLTGQDESASLLGFSTLIKF